jgi:hypothetical protein
LLLDGKLYQGEIEGMNKEMLVCSAMEMAGARVISRLLACLFALTVGTVSAAQGTAPTSGDWQFEVTPYLFASGLKGDLGVKGVTTNVDVSFEDISSNLDAGFMGMFTAQRGRWVYSLDGTYMKLTDMQSKTVTGPFGVVSVNGAVNAATTLKVWQGSIGYRVLDERTKVDMVGALRYTEIKADVYVAIGTVPAVVFPGGASADGGKESWTDAVIGARVVHPLNDQWSLVGYVDAGGSSGSSTYQWLAGVNWEFSKGFSAKAGYRELSWDYDKNGALWDIKASGPYLGLGIKF